MLIAPIYLWAALPNSVNNLITYAGYGEQIEFWGSYIIPSFTGMGGIINWGAAIGWLMSFAAFAILLVGAIIAFSIRKVRPVMVPHRMQFYEPSPIQYAEQSPPQPPQHDPPPGQ